MFDFVWAEWNGMRNYLRPYHFIRRWTKNQATVSCLCFLVSWEENAPGFKIF